MNIKVKLLGNPSVIVNKKKIDFPLKKVEGLFYYLLLSGPANKDKLADLLWGTKDESLAQHNLRNGIYLLRKSFPRINIVIAEKNIVKLNPNVAFEKDVDLLNNTEVINEEQIERLGEYFLDGFYISGCREFEEWIFENRHFYSERFLNILKKRMKIYQEKNNIPDVTRSLQLLIKHDPFDEISYATLMKVYAASGQEKKAIKLYEKLKYILKEEFELEPEETTQEIYNKITLQDQKILKNKNHIKNDSYFFYGRKEEIRTLLSFADFPGLPSCINIYGEAGVGKSYLATHFLENYTDPGAKIYHGQAYEMGQSHLLSPWNRILGEVSSDLQELNLKISTKKATFLSAFFPSFAQEKPGTVTYELTNIFRDPNPIVLGQIIAEVFQKIQTKRKGILVFEDLQWIDNLSLQVMESFLCNNPGDLMLLFTSRSESGKNKRALLKKLESRGQIKLFGLHLKPFSKEDTKFFCESLIPEGNLTSEELDFIYCKTEGLALFLSELMNTYRDEGSFDSFTNRVSGILENRFFNLSEEEQQILQYLSAFLAESEYDYLLSLSGFEHSRLSTVLESLFKKGWITEVKRNSDELLLEFNHQILKNYLYDNISAVRRNLIHKDLAQILEKHKNPVVWNNSLTNRIFFHYQRAGLHQEELDFYFREMRMHIMLNHEVFPLLPDETLQSCSAPFSDRQQTEMKFEEISELLHKLHRQDPDNSKLPDMESSYLEIRGGYLIAWGSYLEGIQFIKRSLKIAKRRDLRSIILRCLQHYCLHGVQTENIEIIETYAKEMYKTARELEKEEFMGLALRYLGIAAQLKKKYEIAEKIYRASINLFEGLRDWGNSYTLSVLASWNYIGDIKHLQGDLKRALEYYQHCINVCEERKFFWGLCLFHANAGYAAMDMNDLELMKHHIYTAVSLFEKSQGGRSGSILYSLKSIAEVTEGRYKAALDSLCTAEKLCSPIRKKSWIAVQTLAKGWIRKQMESNGELADIFKDTLEISTMEYAKKAKELFNELGNDHKVDELDKFIAGEIQYPVFT